MKGHQDKGCSVSELPIPAQINVICDRGCTDQLLSAQERNADRQKRELVRAAAACMMTDGVPVTGGSRKALARNKYSPTVAAHLGLDSGAFMKIDWEVHARTVKTLWGKSLKRVLRGPHPTRTHLRIVNQYPTSTCQLCGSGDKCDHFLHCASMNIGDKYTRIRDKMQHITRANGMPDHLVNTIPDAMVGKGIKTEDSPAHAKGIYEEKKEIGWWNFLMGLISKCWSQVRDTDKRGVLETEARWSVRVINVIIKWMHQKWWLRCNEFKTPYIYLQHQDLYGQCRGWWTKRDKKHLHRHNAYLKNARQKPKQSHTKDYLSEWIRTMQISEESYARY